MTTKTSKRTASPKSRVQTSGPVFDPRRTAQGGDPNNPRHANDDREFARFLVYEMDGLWPNGVTRHVTKQKASRSRPGPYEVLLQEAQGTAELTRSEQLPVEMNQEKLKQIGIKILRPTKNDELFVDVKLPKGWKKVYCDEDSRTTHLLDEKGHRRGYVWYKGATYDRKAYGIVHTRYSIETRSFNNYTITVCYVVDKRNRKMPRVLHVTEPIRSEGILKHEESQCAARKLGIAWLTERYPSWERCDAYWHDPQTESICPLPSYAEKVWPIPTPAP